MIMNENFSFLITLRKTLIASGAPVPKIYHLQKLVTPSVMSGIPLNSVKKLFLPNNENKNMNFWKKIVAK